MCLLLGGAAISVLCCGENLMVEAGYHQEVHLREYLDVLQSGGHRAQPSPTAVAREARPAPRCPEERQCWSADAGRRFGGFTGSSCS